MATLFCEVNATPRQDWHLTSSGVGHQYRPGIDFYDNKVQTTVHEPLPLVQPDQVNNYKMHTTTTGSFHDKKFIQHQMTHPFYRTGPNFMHCNYVKDLAEKLGPGSWRRPLSMGYQKSEMQDEFYAKEGIRDSYYIENVFKKRPFLLNDHLQDGPTKYGIGSTINPRLRSRIIDPSNMGVVDVNEPYVPTNRIVYCHYTPQEKELSKYAQVNEQSFHNPVSKTIQPMRDVSKFKLRTIIPRLPKAVIHMPHRAQLTEYQEIYQRPSDVKYPRDVYCPEDTPWTLTKPSTESVMTVPRFYTTEYQTIGKKESVPV